MRQLGVTSESVTGFSACRVVPTNQWVQLPRALLCAILLLASFTPSSYTILSSHFFLLGIEITGVPKSGLYEEFIFRYFVPCLPLTNLFPSINSTGLWTARIQLLFKQQRKRKKQENYLGFISGHFMDRNP